MYGSFTTVEEFNMTLIPFDSDLLSMEMNDAFKVSFSFLRNQWKPRGETLSLSINNFMNFVMHFKN